MREKRETATCVCAHKVNKGYQNNILKKALKVATCLGVFPERYLSFKQVNTETKTISSLREKLSYMAQETALKYVLSYLVACAALSLFCIKAYFALRKNTYIHYRTSGQLLSKIHDKTFPVCPAAALFNLQLPHHVRICEYYLVFRLSLPSNCIVFYFSF